MQTDCDQDKLLCFHPAYKVMTANMDLVGSRPISVRVCSGAWIVGAVVSGAASRIGFTRTQGRPGSFDGGSVLEARVTFSRRPGSVMTGVVQGVIFVSTVICCTKNTGKCTWITAMAYPIYDGVGDSYLTGEALTTGFAEHHAGYILEIGRVTGIRKTSSMHVCIAYFFKNRTELY